MDMHKLSIHSPPLLYNSESSGPVFVPSTMWLKNGFTPDYPPVLQRDSQHSVRHSLSPPSPLLPCLPPSPSPLAFSQLLTNENNPPCSLLTPFRPLYLLSTLAGPSLNTSVYAIDGWFTCDSDLCVLLDEEMYCYFAGWRWFLVIELGVL
ncbi:hypothetical protein GSI_13203 [Ganoderma sinense ZZ0214-1]|uniref:Uncharacterized protein n=1 Tax=Ganoderma sinense ZZ0214-1 TaxID=1077348 RepID=A0A2G8RV06_9APHY|nr:hypothetical protein GSI_13203 [Ganoderma sinense ZZ0214-1]